MNPSSIDQVVCFSPAPIGQMHCFVENARRAERKPTAGVLIFTTVTLPGGGGEGVRGKELVVHPFVLGGLRVRGAENRSG